MLSLVEHKSRICLVHAQFSSKESKGAGRIGLPTPSGQTAWRLSTLNPPRAQRLITRMPHVADRVLPKVWGPLRIVSEQNQVHKAEHPKEHVGD